jgi:hypothetical protein
MYTFSHCIFPLLPLSANGNKTNLANNKIITITNRLFVGKCFLLFIANRIFFMQNIIIHIIKHRITIIANNIAKDSDLSLRQVITSSAQNRQWES